MLRCHWLQVLLRELLLSQSETFSIACLEACRGLLPIGLTIARRGHRAERCKPCNATTCSSNISPMHGSQHSLLIH